jgi:hypothetical protein
VGNTLRPFTNTEVDQGATFDYLLYMTTIVGSILSIKYFCHCLIGMARSYGYKFAPGSYIENIMNRTSNMVGTARLKQAATRKLNALLRNARSMHGTSQSVLTNNSLRKSHSEVVFKSYMSKGGTRVVEGNILWVWRRILTGELFDTEGIWLPSRLLVFQFGQVIISMFTLFFLFFFVETAANKADEAQKNLDPDLPKWFLEFVPTGSQVRMSLTPAACVAVTIFAFSILIYIPSSVKTILRYRCGQYRALGDPIFLRARDAPDAAYMNTANAIYGAIASSLLFFVLVGLTIFLFVWEFSRGIMLLLLAWGLGLTITITMKSVITSLCRRRFFRAFYRVAPVKSNLASLALECWFIGLGGGVLVGRITQFLLASAFWVGRIDEPFLADNIALFGYKFDYVPLTYIKELLVHEAHRHPYLERLSTMYMMRLRYKSFASSDACGAWRQLFVLTLLPWLMHSRVNEEQRCIESLRDQESEREVEADEDRDALVEIADDIFRTTLGVSAQGLTTIGMVGKLGLDVVDVGLNVVDVGTQGVVNLGHAGLDAAVHVGNQWSQPSPI